MNLRKYLVLLGVVIFGSSGDALLSRGMKEVGEVPLNHWHQIIFAVAHPWVTVGVLLLIGFFACYMSALSWADLTYVLPATSIGYVLLAFIAKFLLHENVTATRWLGIVLIAAGVGFVAQGPALTHHPHGEESRQPEVLSRGGA
ncbi:MAG TPA: EamA family transporter [Terriglobales bacterium]|nr:EamA family transporter [Terriglobales bacterium]